MRRPAIGVHIGDMLIGLVAVRILPDQPRNVGRGIVGQCRRTVEQRIELLLERRVAAEMLDQPITIMLVEEGSLPTVRLGVLAPFGYVMASQEERRVGKAGVWTCR